MDKESISNYFINEYSPSTLKKDLDFSYEGQYLNAAICLVKGIIFLYKKKKCVKTISKPEVIGFDYLKDSKIFPYRIHIQKGAKIIIISKHDLEGLPEPLSLEHD